MKNLIISAIVFLICFSALSQSEVAQPENLDGLTYDFNTKEIKGTLPFDEFTFLQVNKGNGKFYPKAFLYEIQYVNSLKLKKKLKKERKAIFGSLKITTPDDQRKCAKGPCKQQKKAKNTLNRPAKPKKDDIKKQPAEAAKKKKNEQVKVRKPVYLEKVLDTFVKGFFSLEALDCFKISLSRNPFKIIKVDTLEYFTSFAFKAGVSIPLQISGVDTMKKKNFLLTYRPGVFRPLQTLNFIPLDEENKSVRAIITPLEPNKLYEIVLNRKLNDDEISKVFEYLSIYWAELEDNGGTDQGQFCKSKEYYEKEIATLEKRQVRRIHNTTLLPSRHEDFLKRILKKKLVKSAYKNNVPALDLSIDAVPNINTLTVEVGKMVKKYDFDFDLFSKWMYVLSKSDNSTVAKILNGTNYPKTKTHDYHKIQKNLKKNIDSVTKLKTVLEKIIILDSTSLSEDLHDVLETNLISRLQGNYEKVEKYNKAVIEGEINRALGVSELLSISTRGKTLKTVNSRVLIPDFGFVNAFAHDFDGEIRYFARPYFGLNFHFGGINKEQRLNEIIEKDFRHRFSIALGVTIGKIETDGYTDFFNGISPMLGLNYRLDRQIRFGVGTLFLRENEANPIINESRVQIAPYASLSLDFGLFEQAGKLVGKVF